MPIYYKVIRKLEQAKFVKKVAFPKNGAKGLSVLFYATDKGAKYIAREVKDGAELVERIYKKVTTPISSINHYYHRKRMTDFRIMLDRAVAEHEVLQEKFLITDTEREKRDGKNVPRTRMDIHNGEKYIDPDIAFALTNGTFDALFFVEVDTAKETITGRKLAFPVGSIAEKFNNYLQVQEELAFMNVYDTTAQAFRVLFVTETQTHIEGIQKKLQHMTEYRHVFLFCTHEDLQNGGFMSGEIWQTLELNSPKESIKQILQK